MHEPAAGEQFVVGYLKDGEGRRRKRLHLFVGLKLRLRQDQAPEHAEKNVNRIGAPLVHVWITVLAYLVALEDGELLVLVLREIDVTDQCAREIIRLGRELLRQLPSPLTPVRLTNFAQAQACARDVVVEDLRVRRFAFESGRQFAQQESALALKARIL